MLTGVVAAVLLCLAQATDRSDRAAAGRPNCLTYNAPYATFSPGFGNVNWDTLNKSVQSSINASLYACGEQCELAVVSRAVCAVCVLSLLCSRKPSENMVCQHRCQRLPHEATSQAPLLRPDPSANACR